MLNSIKSKFLQSVKSKRLNVFGLFFVLAFLILVITKLSETYIETIPFSVEFKNLPDTNIITLDDKPKIDVTVSTHGFNLLSYYFYPKSYALDIKNNVYVKENAYTWIAEKDAYNLQEQLGKSAKIISVKPDTLFLPFGVLSTKKVPVILKSKINFASGYDTLEGIKIIPDSVDIIGAEAEISKINYVETQPFNLKKVKTNLNETIYLDFLNNSKRLKVSEEKVVLKAEVEKFTEGAFEIPVTILNVPNGIEINYFPKTIKVAYYLSLKDYKQVKPKDFVIECDYNTIQNTEVPYFVPKLIVNSSQIKSAKMKQNKVEYIIVK